MPENYLNKAQNLYQEIEKRRKEKEDKQAKEIKERFEEDEKARQRREELRIQKLSASGKSLLEYVIDRLIELSIIYNKEKFHIRFHKIGFEENGEGRRFCLSFLEKLQKYGCLEFVMCMDNENFSFWNCNSKKLISYKEKINVISQNKTEKDKIKEIIPIERIPLDIKWEDITIKIKDTSELDIFIKEETYERTFKDSGLEDTRIKDRIKIKKSAEFLFILSANKGIFPLSSLSKEDKGKREKEKQELVKIFKRLFPTIAGEPFYAYNKQKKFYKIKIKLSPQKSLGEYSYEDKNIKEDRLGAQKMFNEQTS